MSNERNTGRNKAIVRRIYDELWNERKLEVAGELIADHGRNYDTGLTPQPFGPEQMKTTVGMISPPFPITTTRSRTSSRRKTGWWRT